ncbi:MAG: hypothetical protein WCJ69_16310 [Betaproteobacteria bacterium]|jgi:hypothetical protein
MTIKSVVIAVHGAILLTCGALSTIAPATTRADETSPGPLHTRSFEDIRADLMRDWGAKPSGTYGTNVHTRSLEDANADLVRNWDAKPSGTYGVDVKTRSKNEAYNDLVRASDPFGRPAPTGSDAGEVLP